MTQESLQKLRRAGVIVSEDGTLGHGLAAGRAMSGSTDADEADLLPELKPLSDLCTPSSPVSAYR
jgi:hypothetical protein